MSEDEIYERALREVLVRDFDTLIDEISEYQALTGASVDDVGGLALAVDEVRAVRNQRRRAS